MKLGNFKLNCFTLRNIVFVVICMLSTCIQHVIAQQLLWQQNNGPFGGSVFTVTVNAHGHIFAGVWMGGVYRSTDNGSTWMRVGNPQVSIKSLAINDRGDIFAVTGGVLRSTDNGDTWQKADSGITGPGVTSIFVERNGDLFAGTQGGGVYRSTNNGLSWMNANGLGLTNFFCYAFASFSDGLLLMGTDEGIFKSTDYGQHWSHIGLLGIPIGKLIIGNDGCIFAGHYSFSVNNTCIYRSLDTGKTWIKADSGITDKTVKSLFQSYNGYLYVGTTQGGVFRSTDNGKNWRQNNDGLKSYFVRSFSVDSTKRLIAGTDFGVAASNDNGDSWIHIGVPHSYVYSLAISSEDVIFASTNYGVFRSTDYGKNWSSTILSQVNALECFTIKSKEYVFAGTAYYSTDRGEQWHQINSGLATDVISFACDSNGQVYSGTHEGIFRLSEDFSFWSATGLDSFMVNSIAISPNNGMLFAGTERFRPYYHNGVFRSTDNGANWSHVLDDTTISCLLIHSNGCIIAATNSRTSRTYRSTNYGVSWEIITNGLQGNVLSLAKNSSEHTFACTPTGVFRSTDYGDSWVNVSLGLPTLTVSDVVVDSKGFAYAATYGNGVYRTLQSTTSVGKELQQLPYIFSLYQNYPNPFNSSTVISYQLPVRSFVSLKVYDLLGREVETLVAEEKPAGTYTTTWNGSRLTSGVYVAKLTAGAQIASKKLLFIK